MKRKEAGGAERRTDGRKTVRREQLPKLPITHRHTDGKSRGQARALGEKG